MPRYDSAPETAEAELRRASQEANRVEEDLAGAREAGEEFEVQLLAATTDDERSHLRHVLQVVEGEIEALEQELVEADEDLGRTHDYWFGDD
jgi:predicted  nucleic acid-binding Zn-ribbon protein